MYIRKIQTEMMTHAELAFSALDRDKTGYVTVKQLKKLSNKLSSKEVKVIMAKVSRNTASLEGFKG